MPDSCCAIGCSQLTAEYEAGVMFLPHPKRRKTVLLSIRLEFATSNLYCLIAHYNYDYFKMENNPPSAVMGIAHVARLGWKSGPIWQHWRRRH